MSRIDHLNYGLAVLEDEQMVTYHSLDSITLASMSEAVGSVLVLIHGGYDIATDSTWPSFRHPSVTAARAEELIKARNRMAPDEIFPSRAPEL